MLTQVSYKIPQEMKDEAYAVLKSMGIKPSDAIRDYFAYIVKNRDTPVKKELMSAEDREILAIIRERKKNPQMVRVSLDDL
jgi:RHH-type rel operon transcriptional repressor/antitoxin RelB